MTEGIDAEALERELGALAVGVTELAEIVMRMAGGPTQPDGQAAQRVVRMARGLALRHR